ncbi:LamG-like jellyroll fold domain-containing protein, partial [Thiocapsa imhoffii]
MSGGLAYALHSDSPRPSANLQIRIANNNRWISAGSQLPVRTWTHLAATHDGSSQALFVNGEQVVRTSHSGNLAVSNNPLRIGGNTVMAGRAFEGVIDEVRIHNRALSVAELTTVAGAAVGSGGAPAPAPEPPVAAPVADFAANTTRGEAPLTVRFENRTTGEAERFEWAFGDGQSSTARAPTHRYTAPGTYTVELRAVGPGGEHVARKTGFITVTAAGAGSGGGSGGGSAGGGAVGGLVAAYGFEESGGSSVQDASGQGNHGTLANVTRTTQGRFGRALSFNGNNSLVTVENSASLGLTDGMTLSAWVYPTA